MWVVGVEASWDGVVLVKREDRLERRADSMSA